MAENPKHLKGNMMRPEPSPPASPLTVENHSSEEDVTSDQGLSLPVTDQGYSSGEENSPLFRPRSNSTGEYISVRNPATPAWQQGREKVSQQTWIKILSILTVALFIDVMILSFYLYYGPYVGPPRNHEPIVFSNHDDTWKELPPPDSVMESFAFGSSSSQDLPQTYWDTVSKFGPDLVVLAGDNVYGDCTDANCSALKTAYEDWASHPSFAGAKENLAIVATLDDNDYGLEDADMNNPYKDTAKQLFLDFFHITDERQDRTSDGVYTSYEWGPEGQRVQLILLDTRYARSPFLPTDMHNLPGKERYRPDYTSTDKQMLSDEQWKWLEAQLVRPTNVRLIVSSIQVLADGTGFECWRMLPHERKRLLSALEDNLSGTATVILSGDRLMGGFYQNDNGLVEVTSSSWTHTIPYGVFKNNCKDAEECDEVDPRRVGNLVRVNNFGSIGLDWEKRIMTLALRRVEPSFHNYTHYSSDEGEVIQSFDMTIP